MIGEPPIWRIQVGPTMHLGLSGSGRVEWQKSAISGTGRLKPLTLSVAVEIATGRIYAELEVNPQSTVEHFLTRALENSETLGAKPRTIVFPKSLVTEEAIRIASNCGANIATGTQSFKARVKISRHFEDYLQSQMDGHESLKQIENLILCIPKMVTSWNVSGQSKDGWSVRYCAGRNAIETSLGKNPKSEREQEFRDREFSVSGLELVRGETPDFHFRVKSGNWSYDYFGFHLHFNVAGNSYKIPLFSGSNAEGDGMGRPLRFFNADRLFLLKSEVPVELRSAWAADEHFLNSALSLSALLRAARERGTSLSALSSLMAQLVTAWIAGAPVRQFGRPMIVAETQPLPQLLDAGVSFVNESWERIGERHFWRVIAVWNRLAGARFGFARVQVEVDSRIKALAENSAYAESVQLNEMLCDILFGRPQAILSQVDRARIVDVLSAKKAARMKKQRS